jgi:aspartate/tyrosine/aromatic aminotransferase
MDLATGAMGSLIPKLVELLKEEYRIQTRVKKDVEFLEREMKSMEAALRKVAMVARDQLDEQVKIWANDVRELSYEMEDLVDSFLVRVADSAPATDQDSFKGLMKKMGNLLKKGKTRDHIAEAVRDIKDHVQEVSDRRDRYKVDDAASNVATTSTVDPRILALFKDQKELVGIEGPRDELIKRLTDRDDVASKQQPKILSISGFGGLGKTTLAKAIYDVLRPQFDSGAFVSVGRNPNMKKIFKEILFEIDMKEYADIQASTLDETQLIKQISRLLQNKRYTSPNQ